MKSAAVSMTVIVYRIENIFSQQCIFVHTVTHAERKAPSVCMTLKMLSSHHFSKSHKALWHLFSTKQMKTRVAFKMHWELLGCYSVGVVYVLVFILHL